MGFAANYARNLVSLAARRQPTRPLLFSYYVTHRCELACCYCSDGAGRPFRLDPVPELSTADAQRLIGILSQEADTLDVTGGEPMMREDLELLLSHARECGMRTVLNTKGIGLAQRPDLLRFAHVLVLSVDSLESVRLGAMCGCTATCAEQILNALDYAASHCSAKGTRLVVSTVVTPDNIEEVAGILDFTRRNGIGFQISPEIRGVMPNARLREMPAYDQLMRQVIDAKRSGAGVIGMTGYLEGILHFRRYRCHPLLMPVIRPDGCMAYPCLEMPAGRVNVLEAGSYTSALRRAAGMHGPVPDCGDRCQIFCHMALSLLQRHPFEALREAMRWARMHAGGPRHA